MTTDELAAFLETIARASVDWRYADAATRLRELREANAILVQWKGMVDNKLIAAGVSVPEDYDRSYRWAFAKYDELVAGDYLALLTRAETAEAEVTRLREALRTHGDHLSTCSYPGYRGRGGTQPPCNCGFAALTGLDAVTGEPLATQGEKR